MTPGLLFLFPSRLQGVSMASAVPSVLKAEVSYKGKSTPSKGSQSSPTYTSRGPECAMRLPHLQGCRESGRITGKTDIFAALNISGCCQQGRGDMVSVSLVNRVRRPQAESLCCPLAGNLQRGLNDRAQPP